MLREISTLYTADLSDINDEKITDLINFLGQMLGGGQLKDHHIANLQRVGIKALQHTLKDYDS